MVYVKAAILGILEGLTEFLPISSTAHLLIGVRLLGVSDPGGIFTVIIQFGAVLAVMWKRQFASDSRKAFDSTSAEGG